MNVPAKFEVCIALPIPKMIAMGVLVGVAHPQSCGRGGPGWEVGDGTIRKSDGEFL